MWTQQSDANPAVEDKEELLENVEPCGESPPPSYDDCQELRPPGDANAAESLAARDSAISQLSVLVFRVFWVRALMGVCCFRVAMMIVAAFIVTVYFAVKSFQSNGYRPTDSNPPTIEFTPHESGSNTSGELLQLMREITCDQLPPLTFVEPWEGPEGRFVLRVNRSRIPSYVYRQSSHQDLLCCYFPTLPTLPHSSRRSDSRSTCVPFKDEVFLTNEDLIEVVCKSPGSSSVSKIVYKNIHPVMANKIADEEDLRERTSPENDEQMNVLIFGFYVFSDSSIMKKLPKTVEFMRKTGFIKFENFREVNLSKFSNDLALIKGQSLQSTNEYCSSLNYTENDECRLNPDEFVEADYIIDRHEYYMALRDQLDSILDDQSSCLERKFTPDLFFRHVLRATSRIRKYLYYSIDWLNGMTTSDFEHASFDSRTSKFLFELRETGVYNDTLVLFITYTDPRDILYKSEKEILKPRRKVSPTLYLAVPQWFQNKYPRDMKNLWANRRKLVTPYDIYLTTKEISNKQNYYTISNTMGKKYKSLLQPIDHVKKLGYHHLFVHSFKIIIRTYTQTHVWSLYLMHLY